MSDLVELLQAYASEPWKYNSSSWLDLMLKAATRIQELERAARERERIQELERELRELLEVYVDTISEGHQENVRAVLEKEQP